MIALFKNLKYLEENEIAGPDTINPIITYLRNVRSLSPYLKITQDDRTGGLTFDLDDTLFREPPQDSSSSDKSSSTSKSESKSASKSSSSVDSSSSKISSSSSKISSSSDKSSSSSKISSSSDKSSSSSKISSSSDKSSSSSKISSSSSHPSSSSGHHHDSSSSSKSKSKSSSSSDTGTWPKVNADGVFYWKDGIYITGVTGQFASHLNGYWLKSAFAYYDGENWHEHSNDQDSPAWARGLRVADFWNPKTNEYMDCSGYNGAFRWVTDDSGMELTISWEFEGDNFGFAGRPSDANSDGPWPPRIYDVKNINPTETSGFDNPIWDWEDYWIEEDWDEEQGMIETKHVNASGTATLIYFAHNGEYDESTSSEA